MNSSLTNEQQAINNAQMSEQERNNTVLGNKVNYSTFNKSFQQGTTLNAGVAIPILLQEVFPNDNYHIEIKSLIRLSAMASTPFMSINYDVSVFGVPYDQLDREFKQLMQENNDYGYSNVDIEFPMLEMDTPDFMYTENDLANYLNIPINTPFCSKDLSYKEKINLYPILAYIKVWNEHYRDQNLQSNIDCTSCFNATRTLKASNYKPSMTFYESLIYGKGLAPTSKLPSIHTTCLPYQQKGDPIPITAYDVKDLYVTNTQSGEQLSLFSPIVYQQNGAIMNTTDGQNHVLASNGQSLNDYTLAGSTSRNTNPRQANLSLSIRAKGNPAPYSINDLRSSLVLQHLLENFALCGSRYVEQLRSIWGIEVDPKTIGRTEIIGGYNDTLQFNNVAQTSQSTPESPLAQVGSNLYNLVQTPDFDYTMGQHGLIIGILTIRTTINNGGQALPKIFSYKNYLDLFNPMFNGISEQPMRSKEIYYNGVDHQLNNKTFGFNEPFITTKYNMDNANGFFSLNSKTSLFSKFLYGVKYTTTPVLNDEFMRYDPNIIKNSLFNVGGETVEFYHQFIALFNFDIKYMTAQPLFNSPRVYGI